MQKILVFFLIMLAVTACGKKGPLIPPEGLAPAAVADLAVAQKGEYFQLSWSQPTKEAAGGRLADLAGFKLLRRQVLPQGEDCEQCPDAYRLLQEIDLDYLRGARHIGNSLVVNDNDVNLGVTYQYKVIAVKKDGTPSRDSNKPRRRKAPAPPAPLLQAKSDVAAVTLQFSTPIAVPGFIGYNLYRWRQGEGPALIPLNRKLITAPTFEDQDLGYGIGYAYQARTVAEVDGERVESAPSAEASASLVVPD